MARYIDADALMEKQFAKLKEGEVLYRISPQAIYDAPTTDFVPREEVDWLERIINSYALQYGTVVDKQNVIDEAKREVAREIFEEIRGLIRFTMEYNSTILYAKIEFEKLKELKKKYTDATDTNVGHK